MKVRRKVKNDCVVFESKQLFLKAYKIGLHIKLRKFSDLFQGLKIFWILCCEK